MDRFRFRRETKLVNNKSWRCLSIYRSLYSSWFGVSFRRNSHDPIRKRNRYNYNILTVIGLLLGSPAFANTSNTAAPSASASGSVSNFATQVLQGNTIENHYGNGIRCQGPQMSFSPFVTTSFNQKRPMDYTYETPVYDPSVDDDGNLINPGKILYYQQNYSGNKDSLGLNVGAALTFTFPLDQRFQDQCLKAATTQEKIQAQILSKERLNYELARLKNCGELAIRGISFATDSPYHDLCKDVIVTEKMNQVLPHTHKLE